MPLLTNDIEQARLAYSALEVRATSADARVQALQAQVDDLHARLPISFEQATTLRQHAVDRDAENAQLRQQQIGQVAPDVPLRSFVAMLGLAAALGEATMPDRAVPSISTTVQAYLTMDGGELGLRFHQPELGTSVGLGSTTFQLSRIPPSAGTPAPRNLYKVLEDAQSEYANPFWNRFATAAQPPVQPSSQLVIATAQILASTAGWSFPFLVQSIAGFAGLVKSLATLVATASPGAAAAAYGTAADSLASLTAALAAKPVGTAGDVLALAASLDATTTIARTLAP